MRKGQRWLGGVLGGLVLLGSLVGCTPTAQATHATRPTSATSTKSPSQNPQPKQAAAATAKSQRKLRRLIQRDLQGVGGRWSVRVTRNGAQPVQITTGNHPVRRQRAASTIKLYIMLTIFQRAQRHQLRLTSATHDQLRRMIGNSDNEAANQLIATAGGLKAVNRVIRQHGFTQTTLGRHLMDVRALKNGHDNWTSVRDLTRFLTLLAQHRLLGGSADRQMLTLMRHCRNHSKLPLLVKNVTVYNKTGEYPDLGVQNDAALFRTATGRWLTVVVLSQGGRSQRQYPAMNRLGRDVVQTLH
ncbi:serine hydrolase [Levilactobacillus spicheri]|nr:serine hydrolase [Levilactobacillus spicheri]GEO67123.1 serine hydrolase [Levilactobacillus spicheri]